MDDQGKRQADHRVHRDHGATVQVWPINQERGNRTSATPLASFQIGSSGDWGPVTIQAGKRYEFAEVRPGLPVHHFYYEPFIRSDHLIRLLGQTR